MKRKKMERHLTEMVELIGDMQRVEVEPMRDKAHLKGVSDDELAAICEGLSYAVLLVGGRLTDDRDALHDVLTLIDFIIKRKNGLLDGDADE